MIINQTTHIKIYQSNKYFLINSIKTNPNIYLFVFVWLARFHYHFTPHIKTMKMDNPLQTPNPTGSKILQLSPSIRCQHCHPLTKPQPGISLFTCCKPFKVNKIRCMAHRNSVKCKDCKVSFADLVSFCLWKFRNWMMGLYLIRSFLSRWKSSVERRWMNKSFRQREGA